MVVFGVVATKGGVGKTTLGASLGGLLTDIGYRVLLIDADIQPSLSRYFALAHVAPHGLTQMVMAGALTPDCISQVQLPPEGFSGGLSALNTKGGVLHIVRSDTRDGKLQDFLANRIDRLVRIRMAVKSRSGSTDGYDVAIIDTQGAVGYLQDAAVNASDILITPVSPDIISAREFIDGTRLLLDRHEAATSMGYTVPAIRAVINRASNTTDSRAMASLVRNEFIALRGRATMLGTSVPSAVAFRKAATAQVPVHWITDSANSRRVSDVMHALMWELLPNLEGTFAPNHRGALDSNVWPPVFDGSADANVGGASSEGDALPITPASAGAEEQ